MSRILLRALAVIYFALAIAISSAVAQPLATDRDMVEGIAVDAAGCQTPGRVWVRIDGAGSFCVRFWLSAAGGIGDEALIGLLGDIGGNIDGRPQLVPDARSVTDGVLQALADDGSRMAQVPFIVIARPGTFGSSGDHLRQRRTLSEVRVIDAALNALRERYGFKRFHLVGHSGGGGVAAGLVEVRNDVGCAIFASGAVAVRSLERDRGFVLSKERDAEIFDPVDFAILLWSQHRKAHLIVLTDPADRVVSATSQNQFVERVRELGVPIDQVNITASDIDHHGLFEQGVLRAAACIQDTRRPAVVAVAVAAPKPAPAGAPARDRAYDQLRGALATPFTGPDADADLRDQMARGYREYRKPEPITAPEAALASETVPAPERHPTPAPTASRPPSHPDWRVQGHADAIRQDAIRQDAIRQVSALISSSVRAARDRQ